MEMRPSASFQTFTELKLLPAGGGWARFLLVPEADDLMIFLPLFVLTPGPLFQFPCSWVSLTFKLLWVFTSATCPWLNPSSRIMCAVSIFSGPILLNSRTHRDGMEFLFLLGPAPHSSNYARPQLPRSTVPNNILSLSREPLSSALIPRDLRFWLSIIFLPLGLPSHHYQDITWMAFDFYPPHQAFYHINCNPLLLASLVKRAKLM